MKNKRTPSRILGTWKTTAWFGLVVLFLLFAPTAFALDTGLSYGTLTGLGTQDLRVTIMNIIRVILGFLGVVALIIVIYGGYLWMTSAGNPQQIDRAKKLLQSAAIGLVIILSAFAIVSFIIRALLGATGVTGPPGGGGPPGACLNCGQLGSGIIQSVYPTPFAKDVFRNTNIMVTFKVDMDPGTIIDGAPADPGACNASPSNPCIGDLISDNVYIYPDVLGPGGRLGDNEVVVATTDGKTFVFNPVGLLGDGVNDVWYAVDLRDGIEKDNGESAFPGAGTGFLWRFEVGTFVDIDPVETSNVFPPPDDFSDNYTQIPAAQAEWLIDVVSFPVTPQTAAAQNIVKTVPSSVDMDISGTYNCTVDTTVCVTAGNGTVTVNPKPLGSSCSAGDIAVSGLSANAGITGGAANIGCGLTLSFPSVPPGGNQWTFDALAERSSDVININSTIFTFSDSATNAGTVIGTGSSFSELIANIVSAINSFDLDVTAAPSGGDVEISANFAGGAANFIPVNVTGSWASASQQTAGADPILNGITAGLPDQPRNAAIVIDFNEAINPLYVNDSTIIVEYDSNPGAGETWTPVPGTYFISNQYRTVEFLSNEGCVDPFGNPIQNTCGDPLFCLPTLDPTPYEATKYRVRVNAGLIADCSGAADCTDASFPSCSATPGSDPLNACQGTFGTETAFQPEVRISAASGITDAANNTFNGNRDTITVGTSFTGKADGPETQSGQTPYSLNDDLDGTGDDMIWEFYINRNIDLSPPVLERIVPPVSASNTSLGDPAQGEFDTFMLSSSLKPGSNYRDGACYCGAIGDCDGLDSDGVDFECDTDLNRCIPNQLNGPFCLEDVECVDANTPAHPSTGGPVCLNKKYLSLVDRTSNPVGWWVTKHNIDTSIPPDTFADKTRGDLNHTIFAEVTQYGAEFGSGIKDVYQNCFVNSEGPNGNPLGEYSSGACGTSSAQPFCCNGVAMSTAEWETSTCFTGY